MKKLISTVSILLLALSSSFSQPYFQKITTDPIATTTNSNLSNAWADYNNDGYLDLVVTAFNDNCQSCNYPILFFKNNGNGSFTRITNNAIASLTVKSSAATWGDYDNDGFVDLFICGHFNSYNYLFKNNVNGDFTRITTGSIVSDYGWYQSASWCDYDRDGYIDLFAANLNGGTNCLYHNNGNGTFTKILTGNIATDIGYSRGCAWGDYNNDGWPDLFVVNYAYGQNDFLYKNNGNGTFTKIYDQPMVNDGLWGSTAMWADFNNDGWLDLYVTNNSANNRLYVNQGNGTFYVSSSLPSQMVNSHGMTAGDYDNNGYLDIFICRASSTNMLLKNNGSLNFTAESGEIPSQEGGYPLSSMASFADYDNNGKLDLVVSNTNGNNYNYLYKNIVLAPKKWTHS